MASLTWWMWVWVNSGSWWWTGRPGVLRFTGSQRVGHNWVTELNWLTLGKHSSSSVNFGIGLGYILRSLLVLTFQDSPRSLLLLLRRQGCRGWRGCLFLLMILCSHSSMFLYEECAACSSLVCVESYHLVQMKGIREWNDCWRLSDGDPVKAWKQHWAELSPRGLVNTEPASDNQ